MRHTIYVPSQGYITTDNSYEYIGNGVLGDAFNAVKNLIFSKPVKDLAFEGAKSFGTTLAKKGGEKAANKIVDKVFKDNKSNPVNTVDSNEPKQTKTSSKQNKDVLKEIYGDGIFKQSGRGLRRI